MWYVLCGLVLLCVMGYVFWAYKWFAYTQVKVKNPQLLEAKVLDAHTESILKSMSLEEKINQLVGTNIAITGLRLGFGVYLLKHVVHTFSGVNRQKQIPALSFTDGPRGIVVEKNTTCFPVASCRAATWNVILEQQVGDVIGQEARSCNANYFAGMCINIIRHPAWGRSQESYSEDHYLTSQMGIACMHGVHRHNVMVCAKHYAANNIENSRFYVNIKLSNKTLHEMYLPHFRAMVDAGVDSLMNAYNRVNGEYCGENKYLLDTVLRGQWGFKGFVSSDWIWGVYDAKRGIQAGMDVEMPMRMHYRKLKKLVKTGQVDARLIDQSCYRVVRTKLKMAHRPDPMVYGKQRVATPESYDLAQQVAEEGMVLLKNDAHVLPISKETIKSLAVIGELAQQQNLGDLGSSRVHVTQVETFLEGLQNVLGHTKVHFHDGQDVDSACELAQRSDYVLILCGSRAQDEGENLASNHQYSPDNKRHARGGDRLSLTLKPHEENLILQLASKNRNTIVGLIGGSTFVVDKWIDQVASVLMIWYAGCRASQALPRILFGDVNPSGKLPITVPKADNQLANFDPFLPEIDYGYHHGYFLDDYVQQTSRYPFGYGLSYTTFTIQHIAVDKIVPIGGQIAVSMTVTNTGTRAGAQVVQVYLGQGLVVQDAVFKRLCAFKKVFLAAGESQTVSCTVNLKDIAHFNDAQQDWQDVKGRVWVWVGTSSHEHDLTRFEVTVE